MHATTPRRLLRVGLTGGIGSGKSTVARAWVALGAACVDTDALARELTQPGGAALPALCESFGAEILGPDGALDRARMRQLAFGDPPARARLEAILHPLIEAQAVARGEAQADAEVLVYDVPLLAESRRWRARVDRVLVVDCPEAVQIARVAQRPGWDAALAERVMAQQASRARRRAVADAVLYNDGLSLAGLARRVAELHALWAPAPVKQ